MNTKKNEDDTLVAIINTKEVNEIKKLLIEHNPHLSIDSYYYDNFFIQLDTLISKIKTYLSTHKLYCEELEKNKLHLQNILKEKQQELQRLIKQKQKDEKHFEVVYAQFLEDYKVHPVLNIKEVDAQDKLRK